MMKINFQQQYYTGFAIICGFAIFFLARSSQITFPYPWGDESRFYLPAFWWAEHTNLRPDILNAPNGIFWMPDGFTVLMGLILKVFGRHIEVARLACQFFVSVGVTLFSLGFRKFSDSVLAGVLCTLVLFTPPVILAANMVRMESTLFLVVAVAFGLHIGKHYLAAGALLAMGVLFHPALAIATAGYAVTVTFAAFMTREKIRPGALEWLLAAAALLLYMAEVAHIISHMETFKAHMSYQTSRKLSRSILSTLLTPRGPVLFASGAAAALGLLLAWLQGPETDGSRTSFYSSLPVAAIAMGLGLYAVLGAEMPYAVYIFSVTPAMAFSVIFRRPAPDAIGRIANSLLRRA